MLWSQPNLSNGKRGWLPIFHPCLGCTTMGQEQVLTQVLIPCSPCCQQAQARVVSVCTKGGIDGNKHLRLVGQVLQGALWEGAWDFPCSSSCSLLALTPSVLSRICHSRNTEPVPAGALGCLLTLTGVYPDTAALAIQTRCPLKVVFSFISSGFPSLEFF